MSKPNKRTCAAIAAGLLAIVALAGCRKSPDEEQRPDIENIQDDPQPTETSSEPVAPAPVPSETPPASNDIATVEPQVFGARPAPDQQMLDDADATGMTARVTRDEAVSNEATAP